jgi:hypothetical protein
MRLLFSVTILLISIGSVGHAESVIKNEFACRHQETLERYDQLAAQGGRLALDFFKEQVRSWECNWPFKIGDSVRVEKRVQGDV